MRYLILMTMVGLMAMQAGCAKFYRGHFEFEPPKTVIHSNFKVKFTALRKNTVVAEITNTSDRMLVFDMNSALYRTKLREAKRIVEGNISKILANTSVQAAFRVPAHTKIHRWPNEPRSGGEYCDSERSRG